MKYSLLKDASDHYIVKHPAGHSMKIAKSALPEEAHSKIKQLWGGGYAEGGEADPKYAQDKAQSDVAHALNNPNPPAPEGLTRLPSGNYLNVATNTIVEKGKVGYADGGEVTPEDIQPEEDFASSRLQEMGTQALQQPEPAPVASQPPQPGQGIPPSTPGVSESPFAKAMEEYQSSFKKQEAGITGEEEARSKEAKAASEVQGELARQLSPLNFDKAKQQNEADLATTRQESQKLQQDILTNKLDYNRLWKDSSIPAKISAGLGLILGGIGGGLTGRGNDALAVINGAIQRDVEQQRDEIGNKKSLLNYNLQKTNDIRQAQLMTQRQLLDATQAKLGQIASQTQDPLAHSRAQMLLGGIDQERAKLDTQIGIYKMQYQMNTQPFHKEMLGFATPDQSKRAIILPDGQTVVLATDDKSAEDARKSINTISPLMNSLEQIEQIGAQPIDIGRKAEQVRSLLPTILLQAKQAQGLSRVSPETLELLKSQLSDPTKVMDLVRGPTRTRTFMKSLENELHTRLQSASPAYQNPNKVPGAIPKYAR